MKRLLLAIACSTMLVLIGPLVAEGAPSGTAEPTYANGTVVYMSAPLHALGQSLQHSTAVADRAYDLYLAVYPVATDGLDAVPKTIDGWYSPQCDPCFHFGVPDPFDPPVQFHDHIIDGAPGFGTNGTAGSYSPAWRLYILYYNMAYINAHAKTWQPVKDDDDIPAAVADGEFTGPPIDTGIVFLCNITSANAH
jgi:hypothetical protein